MGFDVDFKAIINKIEQFVNKSPERTEGFNDGKLDKYEANSVFAKRVAHFVKNQNNMSDMDIYNELGVDLSSKTDSAKGPRRAADNNGGDNGDNGDNGGSTGGGINIFVNNSVNINIEINISTEIKNEINNNLNCGCGGPGGANIDELVNILKSLLGEGGSIQEFILYLFDQFSTQMGLDLGNLQELLKQILEKLDNQGQAIDKMNEYLIELMKTNYEALQMMGLKMDALINVVQQGDEKNLEMLGKIYTAIMELTNNFSSFTAEQKEQLETVIGLLGGVNIGGGTVNVDLSEILLLLRAIKDGNTEILNGIKEGNETSKQILEALNKISVDFEGYSDDIKQELVNILNRIGLGGGGGNTTVNVDLSDITDLLNQIKSLLEGLDAKADQNNNTGLQILQLIGEGNDTSKAILDFLKTMNENFDNANANIRSDLTKIMNLLVTGGAGGGGGTTTINVDLGEVTALLEELKNIMLAIKEGNEQTGADILATLKDILQVSNEIKSDVMNAVSELINNGTSLESIKALLQTIQQDVSENKEVSKEILSVSKEILAAIKDMDASVQEKLTNIYNLILTGGTGGGGGETTINVDLGQVTTLLEDLKKLLEDIKGDTGAIKGDTDSIRETQQLILEAIEKLGVNVMANLDAILNAIGDNSGKLDGLKDLLVQINTNVEKGNENAQQMGERILAAIANLGDNLIAKFDAFMKIVNEKPGAIDYTEILNQILEKLGKLDDIDSTNKDIKGSIDLILTAITNMASKDVDLGPILDKLDEILQAIKDHKIVIYIKVDGNGNEEVVCEGDDDIDVHEGVGDDNDWLGSNLHGVVDPDEDDYEYENQGYGAATGVNNTTAAGNTKNRRRLTIEESKQYGYPTGSILNNGNVYSPDGKLLGKADWLN